MFSGSSAIGSRMTEVHVYKADHTNQSMRKLFFAFLLLASCAEKKQVVHALPFHVSLAGQDVSFPITVGQVLKTKHAQYLDTGQCTDSTLAIRTIWNYDWHTIDWDSVGIRNIPIQAPIYGVSFYLKSKAQAIDSVRQAIEKQFGIRMKPLQIEHLDPDKEFVFPFASPVYIGIPSRGVQISLRQASCSHGDYPYECGPNTLFRPPTPDDNPEKNLRLAVSFGLTPIEEERFALGPGPIWERKD